VNDGMPSPSSHSDDAVEGQDALEEGLRRFRERDLEGAHAAFERAHRRAGSDARAMSWYGVTLVLVERNSNLGVLYCDQALRAEGPTPELLLNQARVALALGQRERAVRSIARGIEIWPDHEGLQLAKEAMGWRRQPVVTFLGRTNPLNHWLGKLRHTWKQRRRPVPELSPISLGIPPSPRQE
jgi:hypothetical protein